MRQVHASIACSAAISTVSTVALSGLLPERVSGVPRWGGGHTAWRRWQRMAAEVKRLLAAAERARVLVHVERLPLDLEPSEVAIDDEFWAYNINDIVCTDRLSRRFL